MTSSDDASGKRPAANPPAIAPVDPFRAAQTAESLSGELDCDRLHRLAASLAEPSGSLAWSAGFQDPASAGGEDSATLRLTVSGTLRLPCVRCLQPTSEALSLAFQYRLVRDEELAARLDQEQDALDVLAASDQFDLAELIEDEVLMALPLMPRHLKCPDGPLAASSALPGAQEDHPDDATARIDPDRQLPFAGLADELARAAPAPGGRKRKKRRN